MRGQAAGSQGGAQSAAIVITRRAVVGMPADSAVAGTDLRLAGNLETNSVSLFYAGDQLELAGEPSASTAS